MFRNNELSVSSDERRAAEDTTVFELQAKVCLALANAKRLEILALLKDGEVSVARMCRLMDIPKPNLSQHLAVLRQNGLIVARREGTTVHYRISNPHITEACAIMRGVLVESLRRQAQLSRNLDAGEKRETRRRQR